MPRRFRRPVLFALAALLAPIVATSIWATLTVLQARRATPERLAEARRRRPLTLKPTDLSRWQLDALLSVEDPSFYRHRGVDFHTPGQGLTTITQALVKWIYFERFEPGAVNKLRQTVIARWALHPALSKESQLELFINLVYLGTVEGEPVHGLGRAALAYYHKPVTELDQPEYLSLVAMINSPVGFHVRDRPAANAERVRRIQRLLSGDYKPKALRDMYYGPLDAETQAHLAPVSYQPSLY